MKSPNEIAAQIINDNYEDRDAPYEYPATENLNYLLRNGEVDAGDIEALLVAAIEADRKQQGEKLYREAVDRVKAVKEFREKHEKEYTCFKKTGELD